MVRRIESSLAAGGFTLSRDSVAGRRTVIGRRSAIRRHTFVLVAVFKADATPDHLDRFAAEADQYARTVRGGPVRGRSAVAVAVVESGPAVPGWRPGAAGPGRACLVLVDVTGGRVTGPVDVAPDGPADPHLAQLVRDHVATAVGRPAPP